MCIPETMFDDGCTVGPAERGAGDDPGLSPKRERSNIRGDPRVSDAHSALRRAITRVSQQKCNCLEIDAVTSHSFLGIPYVTVSGHPRHIQKAAVFSGQ